MTGAVKPTGAAARPITGRRVLKWMLIFFAVILAANGAFVYFALDSWPGLTTERAYEEGIAYNKTLDAAQRQNALGWQSRVHLGPATPKGRVLAVTLTGPAGPLADLAVSVALSRPVGAGRGMVVPLAPDGDGRYAALVRLPALGRWLADVTATGVDGSRYRMGHELFTGKAAP